MKKITGVFLACVLAALVFAGCGAESKPQDTGDSTPAVSSAAQDAESAESTEGLESTSQNEPPDAPPAFLTRAHLEQVYLSGKLLTVGLTGQELLDNYGLTVDDGDVHFYMGGGYFYARNQENTCMLEVDYNSNTEEETGMQDYIAAEMTAYLADGSELTFGKDRVAMTFESLTALLGEPGSTEYDADGNINYAAWSVKDAEANYYSLALFTDEYLLPEEGGFTVGVHITELG